MHLPELISDLAVILLTGGIVTVIFKKLNQPLVLGYILAVSYTHLPPSRESCSAETSPPPASTKRREAITHTIFPAVTGFGVRPLF